jgi:hypothetical protein
VDDMKAHVRRGCNPFSNAELTHSRQTSRRHSKPESERTIARAHAACFEALQDSERRY